MIVRDKINSLQRDLADLNAMYMRRREELKAEGIKIAEEKLGGMIISLQKSNLELTKQIKQLQENLAIQQAQINSLTRDRENLSLNLNQTQKELEKCKAIFKQEVDGFLKEKNKQIGLILTCIQYRLTNSYLNNKNMKQDNLRQIDIDIRTSIKRADESLNTGLGRLKNVSYLV